MRRVIMVFIALVFVLGCSDSIAPPEAFTPPSPPSEPPPPEPEPKAVLSLEWVGTPVREVDGNTGVLTGNWQREVRMMLPEEMADPNSPLTHTCFYFDGEVEQWTFYEALANQDWPSGIEGKACLAPNSEARSVGEYVVRLAAFTEDADVGFHVCLEDLNEYGTEGVKNQLSEPNEDCPYLHWLDN